VVHATTQNATPGQQLPPPPSSQQQQIENVSFILDELDELPDQRLS
jgi:hypothetical protein